jgi:hypothetical protein
MKEDRIKSAYELAMEKIDKLGEATDDERRRWKYTPEGERLALGYLNGDTELSVDFTRYSGEDRVYVAKGVETVLLNHINLPKNNAVIKESKMALDGLAVIKQDNEGLKDIVTRIDNLFTHYLENGDQQRQSALESLKGQFLQRLQQAAREQRGTTTGTNIDPESHPQFIEERRRMLAHLDLQYINHLDEYKQELASLD